MDPVITHCLRAKMQEEEGGSGCGGSVADFDALPAHLLQPQCQCPFMERERERESVCVCVCVCEREISMLCPLTCFSLSVSAYVKDECHTCS